MRKYWCANGNVENDKKWNQVVNQFSSVQSLSCVRLFATPWIAALQASLSITNSWSSLRLTSIESVTPSSHLILSRPLLLLPSIPPSIRVFSNARKASRGLLQHVSRPDSPTMTREQSPAFLRNSNGRLDLPGPTQEAAWIPRRNSRIPP